MKILEETEFLTDLVSYANNEISLKDLLKKYETDYRTMHNKITQLAETNPDVFNLVVKSHPYNEKKRKDIDFRALMIEVMKSGIPAREVAKKYNVSPRTLQRRVEELSKTDPEFVKLYRKCTNNSKTGKKNSPEIREEISRLEYGEVIISEINEDREKELIKFKDKFDRLVESGMSKEEAAKKLGLTSHSDAYKRIKELERIQKEKQVLNGMNDFKNSLKVNLENKDSEEQYNENKSETIDLHQNSQEER